MTAPWIPPSTGEIVYLTSCLIDMSVEALTTPPDTPNQYSAKLGVASDAGNMNLDAVMGAQGPAGQPRFALQYQRTPLYNNPGELPVLTDTVEDIGKYWLIDELDTNGFYRTTWAYIWWGSYYRQIMMGRVGVPGPTPQIDPLVEYVQPGTAAVINVDGSSVSPTWQFLCPSPTGAPGPVGYLGEFPDVNEVATPPAARNVLAFTGTYTSLGLPQWAPFDIEQYLPRTYSMSQGSFTPYVGIAQQAPIGSFELPSQPFPWTPLVWGHLAAGGLSLSSEPLMIGCQVLVNNQTSGQQVARGLGTSLGEVNIMPHYSTPATPNQNITPTNGKIVIPAGQTATLYINLYNDGQLGYYSFNPTGTTPSPFQSLLDSLFNLLRAGVVTIQDVVTGLANWVGSIPSQIQTQLNAVANLIGTSSAGQAVEAGINEVAGFLINFEPVVNALATALGITAIENVINQVITTLTTWEATVTTEIQQALDAVAAQFGLPGAGHPITAVVHQLQTLQPALVSLADLLLTNTIPDMITLLGDFTGTVTTDIHNAIDAIANRLSIAGTGHTVAQLITYLTNFQSALDGVTTALGFTPLGNDITAVLEVVAPWIDQVLTTSMQTAVDALMNLLGVTGLDHTVLELVELLLSLLGSLFSGYTADAQLFITVEPLLELGQTT